METSTDSNDKENHHETSIPTQLPRLFLGKYVLEKTIGEGSYGKVKLAREYKTGTKFALKIIQKSMLKKAVHIARIKREVRLLKLLHHPHIVRLYDVAETSKEIVLIMEYMEGGELFNYIVTQKKLSEKLARQLFRQIVSAVSYCHHHSIIHRDLKPENLLLDEQLNIKIIDFGFVNIFHPDDKLDTFCGSPFYASPEMIVGKKYIGPEVDMWSLGVILYTLLGGNVPFRDSNNQELFKKIAKGEYKIPFYFSPSKYRRATDLIRKLLTVNPLQRATMDKVLHHAWMLQDDHESVPSFIPHRPLPLKITDISDIVLQKMISYGFTEYANKTHLTDNSLSAAVSIYFLIKEHLERKGISCSNEQKSVSSFHLCDIQRMEQKNSIDSIPSTHSQPIQLAKLQTCFASGSSSIGTPKNDSGSILSADTSPDIRLHLHVPSPLREHFSPSDTEPSSVSSSSEGIQQVHSEVSSALSLNDPAYKQAVPSTPSISSAQSDRSDHQVALTLSSNTDEVHNSLRRKMGKKRSASDAKARIYPLETPKKIERHPTVIQSTSHHNQMAEMQQDFNTVQLDDSSTSVRRKMSLTFQSALTKLKRRNSVAATEVLSEPIPPLSSTLPTTSAIPEEVPSVSFTDESIPVRPFFKSVFLNTDMVTTLSLPLLVTEINRVLRLHHFQYQWISPHCVCCNTSQIVFEIDIAKIRRTDMKFLEFKRKKGPSLVYTAACKRITSSWKI